MQLTTRAENDLESISEHYETQIGKQRSAAAILEILDALNPLLSNPGLGRQSPLPDVRELVLVKFPFIVPYRVEGKTLVILRILHQRKERADGY